MDPSWSMRITVEACSSPEASSSTLPATHSSEDAGCHTNEAVADWRMRMTLGKGSRFGC